jgi:ATPase subunit of ABC transporter with duplicated ATPase domains
LTRAERARQRHGGRQGQAGQAGPLQRTGDELLGRDRRGNGPLQDEIDAENLWDLDSQIDIAMEALRCPPDDADVESLSGGERRRVALCKLLLEAPDMLLLDEPTNHLDAETIAWLQKHLIEYKGTILIVTHDRYFLDDITGWILELDRGRGIPYEGNYSAGWNRRPSGWRRKRARTRPSRNAGTRTGMDPRRRQGPSGQAKARINAYEELASQSEREKMSTAQIIIPNGPRLGGKVIEIEGLKKAMGDKLLIEDLTFSAAAGRHRRRDRPERRRQVDAVSAC